MRTFFTHIRSHLRQILLVLLILSIALGVFPLAPEMASAQLDKLDIYGFVPWSFFCTCSGNWLELILLPPYFFGFYSYQFTTQFAFWMHPIPEIWSVGKYTPGGSCEIYVGTGCSTFINPDGIISVTVGTSIPI